jgi:hypothetical protein
MDRPEVAQAQAVVQAAAVTLAAVAQARSATHRTEGAAAGAAEVEPRQTGARAILAMRARPVMRAAPEPGALEQRPAIRATQAIQEPLAVLETPETLLLLERCLTFLVAPGARLETGELLEIPDHLATPETTALVGRLATAAQQETRATLETLATGPEPVAGVAVVVAHRTVLLATQETRERPEQAAETLRPMETVAPVRPALQRSRQVALQVTLGLSARRDRPVVRARALDQETLAGQEIPEPTETLEQLVTAVAQAGREETLTPRRTTITTTASRGIQRMP